MQVLVVVVAALWAASILAGKWVAAAGAAKVHVVGGDRGWDPSSDLSTWSSARTFRVGDEICKTSLLALSLSLYVQFEFSTVNSESRSLTSYFYLARYWIFFLQ